MSHIVMGGLRSTVTRAVLDLYHLDSDEADWNLELALTGPLPRLLMSGIVKTPPLPGPSDLDLHFIDDPTSLAIGGVDGCLTSHPDGSVVELRRSTRHRARIAGRLRLAWTSFADDSQHEYFIELAIDAAVTTS